MFNTHTFILVVFKPENIRQTLKLNFNDARHSCLTIQ